MRTMIRAGRENNATELVKLEDGMRAEAAIAGLTNVQIETHEYSGDYFEVVSPDDDVGLLWTVRDEQGTNGIYFTGGPMNFESIEHVIAYNDFVAPRIAAAIPTAVCDPAACGDCAVEPACRALGACTWVAPASGQHAGTAGCADRVGTELTCLWWDRIGWWDHHVSGADQCDDDCKAHAECTNARYDAWYGTCQLCKKVRAATASSDRWIALTARREGTNNTKSGSSAAGVAAAACGAVLAAAAAAGCLLAARRTRQQAMATESAGLQLSESLTDPLSKDHCEVDV